MAEGDKPVEEPSTAPAEKEEGELLDQKDGEQESKQQHPLESKWTLWFDSAEGGKQNANTWGQSLRSVYTFSTVEDFWW